jgi:hypothetical protein
VVLLDKDERIIDVTVAPRESSGSRTRPDDSGSAVEPRRWTDERLDDLAAELRRWTLRMTIGMTVGLISVLAAILARGG